MSHFDIQEDGGVATVVLPAAVDLSLATEFKEAMVEAAAGRQKIVIEASEVQKIYTPAIQILLSVRNAMEAENGELEIKDPSEAVVSAFEDVGLADAFGLEKGEE